MARTPMGHEEIHSSGTSTGGGSLVTGLPDLPLFKQASLSIALGNSSDFVKSQATMNVQGNSGDGVIEALQKIAPDLSEI